MGYYRQRALQNLLSVWRLATAFAEIAAHRRSPADLPASQFLVGLLLATYLVLELATLQLLDLLTGPAALLTFVDAAFFLAYIFVALQIFGRQGRFLQTAAALLGTSMLIDVIRLPVLAWAGVPDAAVESLTPAQLLDLMLLIWWVDIASFVVGRALSRPYLMGLLFVILYVIASLGISDWIDRAN